MLWCMGDIGRFFSGMAIILFAGIVFGLARSKADFGNVADWAQAIGGAGAILAAVALARLDTRRQRIQEAEAKYRALSYVTGAAYRAYNGMSSVKGMVDNALKDFGDYYRLGHEIAEIEGSISEIDRLPVAQIDIPEGVVEELMTIRRNLMFALVAANRTRPGPSDEIMLRWGLDMTQNTASRFLHLSNEALAEVRAAKRRPFG